MNTIKEIKLAFLENIFKDSIEYFKGSQNPDGGSPYNDAGSPSGAWNTSGVLWSIVNIFDYEDYTFLEETLQYLLKEQNDDGSIPITNKGDKACIDATSQFIYSLGIIYRINQDKNIYVALEKAVKWLCNSSKNGSYGTLSDTDVVISSTSFAILSLNSIYDIILIPEVTYTISAGVNWLLLNINSDSGWGIYPKNPTKSGTTALAISVLVDCKRYMQESQFQDIICKGKEILFKNQYELGNWSDIIERKAGLTVIRISTPYCVIALLKMGVTIYDTRLQRAVKYILSKFDNGKFTYQDSDIVTWSTRDALLALSELQSAITNKEVLSIFDKNIQLEKENTSLKEKNDSIENRINQIESDSKNKYQSIYKAKYSKFKAYVEFFRNITALLLILLFTVSVLLINKIYTLTQGELISLIGVSVAVWATLSTLIKSKKVDEE